MAAQRTYVWKDPTILSRWTLAGVLASAFATAAMMVLDTFFRPAPASAGDLARQVARSGEVIQEAVLYDSLTNVFSLVTLFALIPGCMWLWRVSANAHVLESGMRHQPAAAIVWFLVPFAHFVMPFNVLMEIWRVSRARSRRPLVIYWAVNVASMAAIYLYIVMSFYSPDFDPPPWTDVAAGGVNLAVHPFFAWMVTSLTAAQRNVIALGAVFSDELPA